MLFILLLLFISCKKDKVPTPCTGVSMAGDRELFVGKWRWYNTIVEEWFDVGPSNYLNYTPQNQGFEYYFTISEDGHFKGYRNDSLVQEYILSGIISEYYGELYENGADVYLNCSSGIFDIRQSSENNTQDSIYTSLLPISINDAENHLISRWNYFVKE